MVTMSEDSESEKFFREVVSGSKLKNLCHIKDIVYLPSLTKKSILVFSAPSAQWTQHMAFVMTVISAFWLKIISRNLNDLLPQPQAELRILKETFK